MGFVSTAIHGWRHAGLRLARTLAAALALAVPAVAAAAAPVAVLQLQGPIGPASADYLERGIHKAGEAGAPLVVIQLDTPGGLDTSMRQVIQAILASPVPVAVFVSPEGARAASAGTYILYAAHIAAMAPATDPGRRHAGGDRVPERQRAQAARQGRRSIQRRRQAGRTVEFAGRKAPGCDDGQAGPRRRSLYPRPGAAARAATPSGPSGRCARRSA